MPTSIPLAIGPVNPSTTLGVYEIFLPSDGGSELAQPKYGQVGFQDSVTLLSVPEGGGSEGVNAAVAENSRSSIFPSLPECAAKALRRKAPAQSYFLI